MALKLRVEISVEIEASDFIEAAEHQRVMQLFEDQLRASYPQATMTIKERRAPRLVARSPAPQLRRSGVVTPYAEHRRATS